MEALEGDVPVEKIFVQRGLHGSFEKELRAMLKHRIIPVQHVPPGKLNSLSGGSNHQGVVLLTAALHYTPLDNMVPWAWERGEIPTLVLLDGVTDVRNVGAIARSVEVLGGTGLVLPTKGSAQINRDAIKTSAGALLHIPVSRVSSLQNALEYLGDSGLNTIAMEQQDSIPIEDVDWEAPVVIVLGDEGKGIRPHILRTVNERVRIPQHGKLGSLNVSVAAGITLYEISRRRSTGN